MKTFYTQLIIGLLAATSMAAIAETPSVPARGPMPFAAIDSNRDGAISQQEFDAAHAQRMQAPYGMRNAMPPRFAEFDLDADGSLSPAELAAGQQNRMQQRQPMRGPGPAQGPGPGRGPGAGRNMPSFAEFDLNGDGVLRQAEFEQARATRIQTRLQQGYMMRNLQNAPPFSAVDANADGVVTPDEFAAAQMQHRMNRTQ